MRSRVVAAGLIATGLLCASAAAAQGPSSSRPTAAAKPAKSAAVRRTSFGRPSLEGMWKANFLFTFESTPRTPDLTVPEAQAQAIAGVIAQITSRSFDQQLDPEVPELMKTVEGLPIVRGERRTRLVVQPADGKIPYTPAARRESLGFGPIPRFDNPEDRPTAERCLVGLGQPPLTKLSYGNQLQIVQTRDFVALHVEYGDDVRIVPFTDTHAPRTAWTWMGDSIARWEGDTLVIETVGLPAEDRVRLFPQIVVPAASTVIERFTRVSDKELNYQFTVVDPKVFTAPWLAEFSWFATDQRMFEHACHEGNYSLPNVLSGARHAEAQAAAARAR